MHDVLRDATPAERWVTVTAVTVLGVLLLLAGLDTAVLPLAAAALISAAWWFVWLRAVVVRRQVEDDGVRAEAARGQLELERWLASQAA